MFSFKNKYFILILFVLIMLLFSTNFLHSFENNINQTIEINYFYTPTCPACSQITPLLEELVEKYDFVVLNKFNTFQLESSNKFIEKLEEYNVPTNERGYVPTIFIKDSYFVGGSSSIIKQIENIIIGYDKIDSSKTTYRTKILGIWETEFTLDNRSLFITTIMLGFFDSLNVCSITVLIFLIVYLLSIGSLKKSFKIGITYTIVIFLFYFLFMIALTSILSSLILKYGLYIRLFVFIVSALVGLILVKDFFFYGRGINIGVPKFVKPILEKQIRKATLISTIVFALLASIVELPCTAVFPLIYSTILADAAVIGLEKILWIGLYNLMYVLPLLIIVFGTYFSWINIKNLDLKIQKNKKWFKLIAGIILILIAIYFGSPFLF